MKGIRIQNILLLLVLTMVVSTVSASAASINLCEKTINTGGSWGVCDPQNPGDKAQGTFVYNEVGTQMDFTAIASGLTAGIEYTLIYYKDIDPLHVAPTSKTINVLGTGTPISGTLTISGTWLGGDIPASDDINPRGKIWIVPTSEINPDGTLKWTGYGQGNIMNGYMFESDMYTVANDPAGTGSTVLTRMGGITYDSVSYGSVTTKVEALLGKLYKIVVSPAVATVIPTGTQQFTAAGSDQGGLTVTITPTWDVVGEMEGTTIITSSGLLKVGQYEQPKDVTVTATQDSVLGSATVSIPEVKSISVNDPTVNFGAVQRGEPSALQLVTISNSGNVATTVSMVASNLASGGNTISGSNIASSTSFPQTLVWKGAVTTGLTLSIPFDAPLGTYTGTIDFSTT